MPPIGTKQAGLLTPYIGQEGEALRQKAIRLFFLCYNTTASPKKHTERVADYLHRQKDTMQSAPESFLKLETDKKQ